MISPEQTRALVEAVDSVTSERDRLFQLVAGLASLLDRDRVVETLEGLLDVRAVDSGDTVVFGEIGIKFGKDNRVRSVYHTIDGGEPVGPVVIGTNLHVDSDR